jgi:hypothetical protein
VINNGLTRRRPIARGREKRRELSVVTWYLPNVKGDRNFMLRAVIIEASRLADRTPEVQMVPVCPPFMTIRTFLKLTIRLIPGKPGTRHGDRRHDSGQ